MLAEAKCLALIMYMEARNQNERTKALVASVAIERAKQENKDVCSSMRKPRAYSWLWDGVSTKVDSKLVAELGKLAELQLKHPAILGRYYFNECIYGKRFKTDNKVIRSEKLCFY